MWVPPSCHPRRTSFLHTILILLLSSHEGTWKEYKEELVKLMSVNGNFKTVKLYLDGSLVELSVVYNRCVLIPYLGMINKRVVVLGVYH